jgi:ankyrin repeat protein
MMAAQYGTGAAVELLLAEGAQASQKNKQGLSALDFARRASRPDAIKLLTPVIAKPAPPVGHW